MKFVSVCFFALLVVFSATAQFQPAWNLEPGMFPQAQPVVEPSLFNYIPNLFPHETIVRAPTPLGWGKKK